MLIERASHDELGTDTLSLEAQLLITQSVPEPGFCEEVSWSVVAQLPDGARAQPAAGQPFKEAGPGQRRPPLLRDEPRADTRRDGDLGRDVAADPPVVQELVAHAHFALRVDDRHRDDRLHPAELEQIDEALGMPMIIACRAHLR
jgi:hypothetical protein